jgi:glutamyl-Q tRNA(Asp) synthetase
MTTPYIGRFAPSPTGPLHFGSLVAALASFLDARAHGGTWLVRMEDVDETRCRPEFAEDILRTLTAFGLTWDGEVMVQSQRKARYADALGALDRHVYACVCSRKEIADSALNGVEGPVYPGTCRTRAHSHAESALRVRTDDADITFIDRIQGPCHQNVMRDVGDFILRRKDGLFAYQFAVTIDDHEQGVTDVVRGADLIDSTARQIHLQRLLGFNTPRYLHIPVATNAAGQKLSKQTLAAGVGSASHMQNLVAALQFLGQTPQANASRPRALLDHAIRQWSPEAIPACRDISLTA